MHFYELNYDKRTQYSQMNSPHVHENIYELYCLVEGTLQAVFYDSLLDVTAPALVVIPPGEEHKNSTGPVKRYLINVSPDDLSEFEKKCLNNMSKQALTLPAGAIALVEEMYALEKEGGTKSRDKQRMILGYFIYLMINQQKADCNATCLAKPDKQFLVAQIVNYIDNNYSKQICYDDLAREFSISTSSLSKHFRNIMNKSIGDYVLQVRIENAKNLLTFSTKSVDIIASLTGFCNSSYFTKRFQKEVGLTPLQYRQHRKK